MSILNQLLLNQDDSDKEVKAMQGDDIIFFEMIEAEKFDLEDGEVIRR